MGGLETKFKSWKWNHSHQSLIKKTVFGPCFFLCMELYSDCLSVSNSCLLWARIIKNPGCSTGSLARPFACSLAPLTFSLAPPRSLAHFAHSLTRGTVNGYSICGFFMDHSAALFVTRIPSVWYCQVVDEHMQTSSREDAWNNKFVTWSDTIYKKRCGSSLIVVFIEHL